MGWGADARRGYMGKGSRWMAQGMGVEGRSGRVGEGCLGEGRRVEDG